MEIEADAPTDNGPDVVASFSSPEEHEACARETVLFAYLGQTKKGPSAPVRFPGPNPISMDKEFIDAVLREPYVCSPKVDGTRFQIVGMTLRSGERAIVLVDRRMACFTCTYASVPEFTFAGRGTVFDAELVGSRLYIFDTVMISGDRGIASQPYDRRLRAAEVWIGAAVELGFGDDFLITVRVKPVYPSSLAYQVLVEPSKLGFAEKTDGLVLTPVRAPVQLNTAWKIFKVKEHHTLDFRLVMLPTRQLKAFTHPSLSIPEAIAQRMRNPILQNALQPAAAPTTTASVPLRPAPAPNSSLLQFSAKGKKRPRVTVGSHIPLAELRAAEPAEAPASAVAAPIPESRDKVQWILRLEYSHGGDFVDATRQGIEYNGHKIMLRIREDATLTWLLDEIEKVWRGMNADVMTMALVVECRLHLPRDFSSVETEEVDCDVFIERPRPDKHEPNNSLTITRTLTTLLYGVTAEDLRRLDARPPSDAAACVGAA
jgi:hypothetical protein